MNHRVFYSGVVGVPKKDIWTLDFGVTNQTAMSYCCVQRDKMNINSYKMHIERFKNEPFGTFRFYFLLVNFFIFPIFYEY